MGWSAPSRRSASLNAASNMAIASEVRPAFRYELARSLRLVSVSGRSAPASTRGH